jgi:hypothetical protein
MSVNHHRRLFDEGNPPAKNDTCSATIWCRTLLRVGIAEALATPPKERPPELRRTWHFIDMKSEEYEIFFMEEMGRISDDGSGNRLYHTMY